MNEVILPKRNGKIFSRETLSSNVRRTITLLILTLGAMIIVLSSILISMTSNTAQKGYEFTQLKNKNADLQLDHEKLKTELNETLAINKIENSTQLKAMAEPEQKQYLTKKKPK